MLYLIQGLHPLIPMCVLKILFEAEVSRKQQKWGCSEWGHAGSEGDANASCGAW